MKNIMYPHLELGLEPNEVKVDKFLNKVYVANERSNSIPILDSNLGTLKEIFINTIPHDVEVNDKGPVNLSINHLLVMIFHK